MQLTYASLLRYLDEWKLDSLKLGIMSSACGFSLFPPCFTHPQSKCHLLGTNHPSSTPSVHMIYLLWGWPFVIWNMIRGAAFGQLVWKSLTSSHHWRKLTHLVVYRRALLSGEARLTELQSSTPSPFEMRKLKIGS